MSAPAGRLVTGEDFDRLVAAGRAKGHLDTRDLITAVPISSLEPDEVAELIVRLEEAGVPVELDEALLMSRVRTMAPGPVPPFVMPDDAPAPDPTLGPDPTSSAGERIASSTAPAPRTEGATDRASRYAHFAVIGGGVVALLALIVLAFLL